MDGTSIIVAPEQDAPPQITNFFDDEETRQTVAAQVKLERNVARSIGAACLIIGLFGFKDGVFNGILSIVIMLFIAGAAIGTVQFVILNPMRSIRFGKCVARMSEWANRSLTVARWNSWKRPYPKFLAIDPARRLLAIEAGATEYVGVVIRADQILEAKVEREQHIETHTTHSGRTIYGGAFGGAFGVGRLGGGISKSTSRMVEQAFLEIAFAPSSTQAPCRVVFDFGEDRRQADDWVLMIAQMRR